MKLSDKIKKSICIFLTVFILCSLLSGCRFQSQYTDPDTGELVGEAAPISLLKKSSIKDIVNTDTNVFFLMNDVTGSVIVTGSNKYGLLGQGTSSDDYSQYAVRAKFPERIRLIDANTKIAVAVSDTNNVYVWGDLSMWDETSSFDSNDGFTYKKFKFDSIISDISIGIEHIALLMKDGSVYTLGKNNGQLGYDYDVNIGAFYPDFKKIDTSVVFSSIKASATATYMLTSGGDLYGSSANAKCELGYVAKIQNVNKLDTVKPITSVASAGSNLFALAYDGTVYVCGENTHGVLGLNSNLSYAVSLTQLPLSENVIQITADNETLTVHFITEEGLVYACGINDNLNTKSKDDDIIVPTLVNISSKVATFYGNGSTRFYIDKSRHLYTYGDNSYGQMPDVTQTDKAVLSPVRLYLNVK